LPRPDAAKKEYGYTWPRFLPGGKELLFSVWGATFSILRLSLPDLERKVVAPGAWSNAIPTTAGHFLAGNEQGDVHAWRNDGSGSPTSVLQRIHSSTVPGDGLFKFDVSDDGTLVYAPGDIRRRSLVMVDETGRDTIVSSDPQAYSNLSLSPDGRKVALLYNGDIWIEDLERGNPSRALTSGCCRLAVNP